MKASIAYSVGGALINPNLPPVELRQHRKRSFGFILLVILPSSPASAQFPTFASLQQNKIKTLKPNPVNPKPSTQVQVIPVVS
jgi:hypothetical protein